jgi:hypothetical protein
MPVPGEYRHLRGHHSHRGFAQAQGPLPEPELPPPALSSSPPDHHDGFAVNARPMLDPVEPAAEQQDEQREACSIRARTLTRSRGHQGCDRLREMVVHVRDFSDTGRSMFDRYRRILLLQRRDTLCGDVGPIKVESLESWQPSNMLQTGISDPRFVQVEAA